MRRGLKRFITGLMLLLVLAHAGLVLLLWGPLPWAMRASGMAQADFFPMAELPLNIQQNFAPIVSQGLLLPPPDRFWQSLSQPFLKLRYKRLLDEPERQALILSSLSFGGDVFGLQAGSYYYFKKPLDQLSDQEIASLAAFYRVFFGE